MVGAEQVLENEEKSRRGLFIVLLKRGLNEIDSLAFKVKAA